MSPFANSVCFGGWAIEELFVLAVSTEMIRAEASSMIEDCGVMIEYFHKMEEEVKWWSITCYSLERVLSAQVIL